MSEKSNYPGSEVLILQYILRGDFQSAHKRAKKIGRDLTIPEVEDAMGCVSNDELTEFLRISQTLGFFVSLPALSAKLKLVPDEVRTCVAIILDPEQYYAIISEIIEEEIEVSMNERKYEKAVQLADFLDAAYEKAFKNKKE